MRDDFPDDIFTTREALALGFTYRQLAAAVRSGHLRVFFRGVYAPGGWPDDLENRARAAAAVLGPDRAFVDRTAAWLHGIDVLGYAELEILPGVETAALPPHRASRVQGIRGRSRDLRAGDLMVLHGVPVTTPARTAIDLACNVRRAAALSALDAFARLHGVHQQDLLAFLPRFKGRRGVVQARQLIGLMDSRAESARESQLRLAMLDAGLPCPVAQHVVFLDGHEFRLDLAYPAHRIAIEYDGQEFHSSDERRRHDLFRRDLLSAAGWTVIVVHSGDLAGSRLDSWLADVQDALDGRYSTLRW